MADIQERMDNFCKLLRIKYPVIQGGMAWVSDHNLASAVSEAGGLGTIGAGNMTPEVLDKEILETQVRTRNPFAVNLMLLNPDVRKQIEIVIKRHVPVVIVGAGDASSYIEEFHQNGIKVLAIVPTIGLAKKVAKRGVDAIIAEGSEAGGHIGRFSTIVLLPAVVENLNKEGFTIPVIAAGGICDNKTFTAVLKLGASGVQMGTRFVLAKETNVHKKVKELYVEISDVSRVVVTGKAIGLPVQCIRNIFTEEIKELEKKYLLGKISKEEIEYIGVGKLREAMKEGNIKSGSLMAGQCVVRLEKRHLNQPVAEIISEIISEAGD